MQSSPSTLSNKVALLSLSALIGWRFVQLCGDNLKTLPADRARGTSQPGEQRFLFFPFFLLNSDDGPVLIILISIEDPNVLSQ